MEFGAETDLGLVAVDPHASIIDQRYSDGGHDSSLELRLGITGGFRREKIMSVVCGCLATLGIICCFFSHLRPELLQCSCPFLLNPVKTP